MANIVDIRSNKASRWIARLAIVIASLWFLSVVYYAVIAFGLSRVGYNQAGMIPFARYQLKSSSASVRQAAAQALGTIGPKAEVAVPELMMRLQQDSPSVAAASAWSLGQIFPARARSAKPIAPEVITALIQALAHSDGEVRRYSAYAIGLIGYQARAAVPALTRQLRDPLVGYTAARALGEMGDAATNSIGPMTALVSDPHALIRLEAIQAISQLAPWPVGTVSAIQKCQNDRDERVRCAAKKALAAQRAN